MSVIFCAENVKPIGHRKKQTDFAAKGHYALDYLLVSFNDRQVLPGKCFDLI